MLFEPRTDAETPRPGMALVGHGTRDERGLAEFLEVARQVGELAQEYLVEPCFLEIARPDIPSAVSGLLERGVRRLTVAPVLLFAAGHAKRDIPAAVEQATGGIDDVQVIQTPALERHEAILELSERRFQQCSGGGPTVDATRTLLILVARGSSDESAVAAMHRFAAVRGARAGVAQVQACFAAIASPGLDETLRWAATTDFPRIVVQPHLLFAGRVLDQVHAAVAEIAAREPARQWVTAPHLGPDRLVAEAVVELARRGAGRLRLT